jgi:Cu-Zn family superoxide dismutase
MKQGLFKMALLLGWLLSSSLWAASMTVEIKTIENATPIGTIKFEDTKYGLLIIPSLKSIRPGLHGLHIYQHPSCGNAGVAAGQHLDPNGTNKHLGPYAAGHLGDLPVLYVDQSGSAQQSILAPRLCVDELINHSVIIQQETDDYQDKPSLDERIACGVIKRSVHITD